MTSPPVERYRVAFHAEHAFAGGLVERVVGILESFKSPVPSVKVERWEPWPERLDSALGADHPDTLTIRNNLASSYRSAGRFDEAITLGEQVLTDRERVLGIDHPDTLTTRHNLASSYGSAGRVDEAITLKQQVLTDCERILGVDHPDTLTTRNNLASSYWSAGRVDEAITLEEQVLTDSERVLGVDHPDTLTTRNNLAEMRRQDRSRFKRWGEALWRR